jgi:hypothetical protein
VTRGNLVVRTATVVGLILLTTAACSAKNGGHQAAPPATATSSAAAADAKAADAELIVSMYADINEAFQSKPDDGIRALVASQYPADSADVDFARCINAIVPGATTLPASKKLHFVPNILTMTADTTYTVTSDRVKGLHPKGRVYVTDVEINDGGKPTTHERHQAVLNGKAYQFSSC